MKYILRKLLTLIITLFIVSLLAFLPFQVIPRVPGHQYAGDNATPEKVAQLEEELGLDDPVLVRYGRWVADFVQGDWGESYSYNLPVKDMVLEKLPATAGPGAAGLRHHGGGLLPPGDCHGPAGGEQAGPDHHGGQSDLYVHSAGVCGHPAVLCLRDHPAGVCTGKFCVLCRQPGAIFPLHALPGPGGGPVPDGDDR